MSTKNVLRLGLLVGLVGLVFFFTPHSAWAGSATVTWNANTEPDIAGYKIYYGTSPRTGTDPKVCTLCGYTANVNAGNVLTRTFNSLTDGQTHYFSVSAYDTSGNESVFSAEVSKVLPPSSDTTPPTISGVTASSITATGATITWTTNESSDTQVEYGTTTAYGSSTTLNTSLVTSHSQSLSGLTANTLYHYRVKSKDVAGNLATSSDFFTTLSNPPVISAVTASNLTATGATITWTTDKPATSKINYGLTASYTLSTVKDTALVTSHSVTLGSLTSSILYHYQVESSDSGNLTSVSSDQTFTTAAPPSLPAISNIQSSNITINSATITWATDIAADSQVEYGPTTSYGTSSPLDTSLLTTHSVSLTGLSSGITYNYRVKSGGSVSINKTFTTVATASDTIPPAAVTNLATSNTTTTSITLSWTAPGDDGNTGTAASYQLYWYTLPITDSNLSNAFSLTGLPAPQVAGTSQSYTAISLTPNTTYYFALKTLDEAGNLSLLSNVLSAKTTALTTVPTTGGGSGGGGGFTFVDLTPPGQVKVDRVIEAASQIRIEWTNPQDSDFVRVVIVRNDTHFPTLLNDGLKVLEDKTIFYLAANLKNSQPYYFSLFTIDLAGNISKAVNIKATPKEGVIYYPKDAAPVSAAQTTGYIPPVITIPASTSPLAFISPYPSGSLIRYIFEPTVYYLENSTKRPISDLFTLLRLTNNNPNQVIVTPFKDALSGYTSSDPLTIKNLNQAKLSSPLIRAKDSPRVYLIDDQNKTRRHIPSVGIFFSYGFTFPQVKEVDKSVLDQYFDSGSLSFQFLPDGSMIKSPVDPKVYILHNSQKRWIKTYEIFKSYKLDFFKVVTLPKEAIDAYGTGNEVNTTTESLPAAAVSSAGAKAGVSVPTPTPAPAVIYPPSSLLKGSSPTIYYIESNQKRAFSSQAVFELLGYKFSDVKTVKDSELNNIPTGSVISQVDRHPNGALIKLNNNPKIYLLENNQLRWITTPAVFKSKGYSFDKVIVISEKELQRYQVGEEIKQ